MQPWWKQQPEAEGRRAGAGEPEAERRRAGAGQPDATGAPDPGPEEPAPPPAEQRRRRRRQAALAGLVVLTAAVGVAITAATDRRDAAVLFVGLPALLALGIALRPPARTLHGAVASGTAFALLLAAMLLQEGAICVLLSAPLVFAVTHSVAGIVDHLRDHHRRRHALVLLPLLAVLSMEGVMPAWRVAPEQTVTVTREVTVPADELDVAFAAGPHLGAPRPLLLRTGFPVPTAAHGEGLEVGDRWWFDYRGDEIVTEVTTRNNRRVGFALVHDGSKTARWLTWQEAELAWGETPDGGTEVEVSITFERGLDPSWWFGPVENALVRAGAAHLLDGLVGP